MPLIILSHRWVSKLVFALLFLLAIGIGYTANWVTGGNVFGYFKKSEESKEILGVHIFVSLLFAFILPNHVLNRVDFLKNLFESDENWIAIAMLSVLTISIIILGLLLSIITKSKKRL